MNDDGELDPVTSDHARPEVDDDYDEVVLIEDADDVDEPDDIILLDLIRLDPADLEVA